MTQSSKKGNMGGMSRASSRFGNKVRPKSLKETLKRLLETFMSEKKALVSAVVMVIVATTGTITVPYMIGRATDAIINEETLLLTTLVVMLLCTYVLISFLNWLGEFMVTKASQNVVHKLRTQLFQKMESLSLAYFDKHAHGDIMSRFTNDIDAVSSVMTQATITFLRSTYTVVGITVLMFWMNSILALAVLFSVPLIFGLSKMISKKTIHQFKGQQKALGKINAMVEETVYGLDIIQTFGNEDNMLKRFKIANKEAYHYGRAAQIWSGLLMPLMNVINNLTFSIVGLLGGYLVIKGHVTVGVVTSFIAYSRQFVRPLNELAFIYNSLMSAVAGAERVFEILDEVEEIKTFSTEKPPVEGHIAFESVSFRYESDVPVLKDINFELLKGQRVAIVGPTGAGKTSIVNLLSNFYRANEGQIRVDGKNILEYDYAYYLSQFGIVLQDSYLFSGTIYDNIRYGKLDATDAEIKAATKLTGVHDMINKLPHKYETKLTFGGLNISQGERQLITIARALMANPKILILDEATSSVDLKTEKEVTKAMTELQKGRTSVIIAHRLSTIRDADLILVVKDGQIIEQGNHESLMRQQGYYHQMLSKA
ncbi:ABC transporter ATP-binding protein [Fusibacter ferrireducens]|uniref:ABC transporter ATP-binding protein n=1 Tax=Fusibacter ferrireducens TaxID=2785058 RepID=A0ABR9ZPQ9_9FIRM|nr:ABC transporter ATP-binding protein [Fusibacter ferrireducens]MBF4692440.1 ABC transporter ATP-binding protein [Fusibacter ferrireducens]